ncbi:MAG: hypothetical protein JRN15_06655 [Nitrososphaerota archaeon]|nr:hypothetical protein [Nitrososphaerota archaeon]
MHIKSDRHSALLLSVVIVVAISVAIAQIRLFPQATSTSGYGGALCGTALSTASEQPKTVSIAAPAYLSILMSQRSTAQLCVKYTDSAASSLVKYSNPMASSFNAIIGVGKYNENGCCSYIIEPSPYVNVSVVSTASSNAGTVFVTYEIDTSNVSGLYVLRIPGICPVIPVAVGHDATELSASDFPGIEVTAFCRFVIGSVSIESVSDASLAYIS